MEPGATLHTGGTSFLSCMKRGTESSQCKEVERDALSVGKTDLLG
jgi:hypothetical protein